MLKLPKEYLSYSQMRGWLEDKDSYRQRYFMKIQERGSRYLDFGAGMAKALESKSLVIEGLVQYPVQEQPFKLDVNGVPFYGYIDQYDPERRKFREIKTGIRKRDGSDRWTQKLVNEHMQLDVYSTLIEEKFGSVDPECHLDWLVTRNKIKEVSFDGHILKNESSELELTGEVYSFPRIITAVERARMRFLIRSVAEEISEDYQSFLKTQTQETGFGDFQGLPRR